MKRAGFLAVGLVVIVVGCVPAFVGAQGMEVTSAKVYLQQTPPLYDKALDLLNQAVAKHPENMEVHYLLGLIYSRRANYEKALQEWEVVVPDKLGKKDRKIYEDERKQLWTNSFNTGVKLFGEKSYDEAVVRFRVAAKANPNDPRANVNLGLCLLNAQKTEESIEPLKKGLAVDPKNVTVWDGLSTAYIRLANRADENDPKKKEYYKSAIETYTNYLQLKKDDPSAYFNLANSYLATGDTTKAMTIYQAGIDNVPQTVDFYFNLSLLYSRMKQYDKVTALLQRAKELKPDDPEILLNLGTTYYNIKQFTDAIDPLEMHLKLKPNSIDGWDTLGRV
ncbi:MAG: tetratricopeptide repeat protein, partial [Candidatus Latescibacteria bacterium]|nr:tetratricopeptide repeat protein [Candidatus Latescibacterota bacterium]